MDLAGEGVGGEEDPSVAICPKGDVEPAGPPAGGFILKPSLTGSTSMPYMSERKGLQIHVIRGRGHS